MPPAPRTVWRASAVALACALAAAPARAQDARDESAEMERPEVAELRLEGVRSLPKGDVRDALATKESSCLGLLLTPVCWISKSPAVYERRYLDRTEFKRDVIRLLVHYYRRGWRDATVDTSVTRVGPNRVRVTFAVTEGAPTRVTSIALTDSASPLAGRRRGRALTPRPGDPLSLVQLDSTVARVRAAYWNRGYGNAEVRRPDVAVDDSANTAAVRITVDRGPITRVGEIRVVHLDARPRVSDEDIRNSLTVAPGDLFRRDRVGESQRALYESGLFRAAVIDTAVATDAATGRTVCAQQGAAPAREGAALPPERGDSVKHLAVCVLEAPPREMRTSVGFTTADFFQVEGRFTHNYWLHSARQLNVSAVVGNLFAEQLNDKGIFLNVWPRDLEADGVTEQARYFAPTYQVGADLTHRWFRSPRNTLGAGAFLRRRSSPGVFVDRSYGGNVAFTRDVTPRLPASLNYTFEINRVEAGGVYFCVNYGVCDAPTVAALGGQQRLSPVALTLLQNSTDAPLAPTRGSRLRLEAQHASQGTLSDFRYNRAYGEASTYRRLAFRRTVLAVRGRVGWVRAMGGTNASVGLGARSPLGGEGEVLHPRTRFYAGGSQSVRGYGENQLGPRVLTIDPAKLLAADTAADPTSPCRPGAAPAEAGACVNRAGLSDDDFIPRPVGGTTLLEGSVEARVPVWGPLVVALFVDGAVLGERSLENIAEGSGAITPGFGVRYISPVGPIRVDIGYRPRTSESLPVITQMGTAANRQLVDLSQLGGTRGCGGEARTGCRIYSGGERFVDRLTLHLSIGEAF